MTNLQRYAEQCAAERIAAQIQNDILNYMEFESEEDRFDTLEMILLLKGC